MNDMRTEKWEMIWDEWKTVAGLYLIMLIIEKYWDLMHYVFMHWGIPLFHHESRDAYTTKQENYHYILHNAAVTVTNSNGCST